MKRRFGFTMIELIMVIVIIGILAAFGLPKFVNFKSRAQIAADDHVFGALKAVANIVHLSYVAMGYEDSWPDNQPTTNPFALLAKAPPYKGLIATWGNEGTIIPDGVTWYWYDGGTSDYRTYFYCPHFNGNRTGAGASKGTRVEYVYKNEYGRIPGEWNSSTWGH